MESEIIDKSSNMDVRGINFGGQVTITNGDTVIVQDEKNAIVRQGMRQLASSVLLSYISGDSAYSNNSYSLNLPFYSTYVDMLFGKSSDATLATMDDLVSKISISPVVTPAFTKALTLTDTEYYVIIGAMWNSGTLNAYLTGEEKLSEVGFYIGCLTNLTPGWEARSYALDSLDLTKRLFSRVSLGENAFVPDPDRPVSVSWKIGGVFS